MTDPDPARVVADADVLAADLLSGGSAREALDHVRAHSWVDLVASDPLLDDVIAALADRPLAAEWRERVERERVRVEQAAGDHPALASAYEGNAAQVLSFDEGVTSAGANLSLQSHVRVSLRTPAAFVTLFDPASLYEAVEGGEYPGPDRDPRG
ncbi:MAG: putative nucleic acid-binding protein [Natronomonas sp.]|jgi:predicted nucleic acid-binding protein